MFSLTPSLQKSCISWVPGKADAVTVSAVGQKIYWEETRTPFRDEPGREQYWAGRASDHDAGLTVLANIMRSLGAKIAHEDPIQDRDGRYPHSHAQSLAGLLWKNLAETLEHSLKAPTDGACQLTLAW